MIGLGIAGVADPDQTQRPVVFPNKKPTAAAPLPRRVAHLDVVERLAPGLSGLMEFLIGRLNFMLPDGRVLARGAADAQDGVAAFGEVSRGDQLGHLGRCGERNADETDIEIVVVPDAHPVDGAGRLPLRVKQIDLDVPRAAIVTEQMAAGEDQPLVGAAAGIRVDNRPGPAVGGILIAGPQADAAAEKLAADLGGNISRGGIRFVAANRADIPLAVHHRRGGRQRPLRGGRGGRCRDDSRGILLRGGASSPHFGGGLVEHPQKNRLEFVHPFPPADVAADLTAVEEHHVRGGRFDTVAVVEDLIGGVHRIDAPNGIVFPYQLLQQGSDPLARRALFLGEVEKDHPRLRFLRAPP